eukprot:jgi/Mesvir1/1478/Mv14461-RA.1
MWGRHHETGTSPESEQTSTAMLKLTPELESNVRTAALILSGCASTKDVCESVGHALMQATNSSFPERELPLGQARNLARVVRTAWMVGDVGLFLLDLKSIMPDFGCPVMFDSRCISMCGQDWVHLFASAHAAFGLRMDPVPTGLAGFYSLGDSWEARDLKRHIDEDYGFLIAAGEAVNRFFFSTQKDARVNGYLLFLLKSCMDYHLANGVIFCLGAHLISVMSSGVSVERLKPILEDVLCHFSRCMSFDDKENLAPLGVQLRVESEPSSKRHRVKEDGERAPLQELDEKRVPKPNRIVGRFEDGGFRFFK